MKKLTEKQIKEFYIQKDVKRISGSKNRYVLYNSWCTGGMSGGNCWDDTIPTYRSSGEAKPRFKLLRDVIKAIDPNISFLKYEEILDAVQNDSYSEYEYYGNSSEYQIEYIFLDDLERIINEDEKEED